MLPGLMLPGPAEILLLAGLLCPSAILIVGVVVFLRFLFANKKKR